MKAVKFALVLLLLAAVFFIGWVWGAWLSPWGVRRQPRTYNTPVLLKQVQSLSQLVTVQYVLEKAVVWDDPPQSLLGQFFQGENHILLLAHGTVKAGVDLSKLTPADLRIEGKKVVVFLPQPQITDAYLDDKQTKVIERKTGFLRPFDKDLEQNVRAGAVEDLRTAARTGGILRDARDRAEKQLAGLFLQLGFDQVEFPGASGAAGERRLAPNPARGEAPNP